MLHERFLGIGAFGDQNASIRGAPVKWQKKPKKQVEEKIDWKMTQKYRELARPLEGSLTMAPTGQITGIPAEDYKIGQVRYYVEGKVDNHFFLISFRFNISTLFGFNIKKIYFLKLQLKQS